MSVWQGAQCPARGPGLSHTRKGGYADDPDTWRCVECGTPLHEDPPPGVPQSAAPAEPLPELYGDIYDHKYVWSITGRCARCGSVELKHVDWLTGVDPGVCTVDHRSIKPWTSCLICFQVIEPAMALGYPVGSGWGRGRGELTERHKKVLEFVAFEERKAAEEANWDGP